MNPSSSISRRTQVLVTAICLLAAAYAQAKNRPPAASEQQLFIGEGIAEADTEYGPVRGFLLRNIYSFRGIPYGDDTGGENRPQIVALFTTLGYAGFTLDRGREIPLAPDTTKDIIFRHAH